MPPLEAQTALFAQRRELIDVRKAHLNTKCDEEEWVELPKEFETLWKYTKLKRWLYGMRKAASRWENDDAAKLTTDGFEHRRAAPTICCHS